MLRCDRNRASLAVLAARQLLASATKRRSLCRTGDGGAGLMTGYTYSIGGDGDAMNFAPGDLVCLKSGGPTMTVEQVGKTMTSVGDEVFVVWFERVGPKQVVQRETFAPALLQKVAPPSGPLRVSRA